MGIVGIGMGGSEDVVLEKGTMKVLRIHAFLRGKSDGKGFRLGVGELGEGLSGIIKGKNGGTIDVGDVCTTITGARCLERGA